MPRVSGASGAMRPTETGSRRAFLYGAGAALSIACAKALSPVRASPGAADVVVIGGGLAGLQAAVMLTDAGARVTLLEAGRRIGGRVFTAGQMAGRPELGASQIGPLYGRVRDAVRRFDLGLRPLDASPPSADYGLAGRVIRAADWAASPHNHTTGWERAVPPAGLLQAFITRAQTFDGPGDWLQNSARSHDIPAEQWLRERGASAEALRLIDEGLIADDIGRVSMLGILQGATRLQMSIETAGMSAGRPELRPATIEGGMSRLADAMHDFLGDRVRISRPAVAIRRDAGGIEVSCRDGERFRGDFAISAVPFSALRRIDIDPPLTGIQAEAVAALRYANTSQVFLERRGDEARTGDAVADTLWTDGAVNIFRDLAGTGPVTAVCVGRKADRLDRLDPGPRAAFVISELERHYPSLRGRLAAAGSHSWRGMATIGGCSHVFAAGQAARFVPAMFRPHGRIHFAGEHTRQLEIGMESAMESGERAALEILARV